MCRYLMKEKWMGLRDYSMQCCNDVSYFSKTIYTCFGFTHIQLLYKFTFFLFHFHYPADASRLKWNQSAKELPAPCYCLGLKYLRDKQGKTAIFPPNRDWWNGRLRQLIATFITDVLWRLLWEITQGIFKIPPPDENNYDCWLNRYLPGLMR